MEEYCALYASNDESYYIHIFMTQLYIYSMQRRVALLLFIALNNTTLFKQCSVQCHVETAHNLDVTHT